MNVFEKIKERLNEKFVSEKTFGGKRCWFEAISIVEEAERGYVPDICVGNKEDVCEWEATENLRKKGICVKSDGLYKPSCNNDEDDFRDWNWIRHFKYCPYCGKKIKAVE